MHTADAAADFHYFCNADAEVQRRREYDAQRLLAAVDENYGVENAFAVEIYIVLLDNTKIVELSYHV